MDGKRLSMAPLSLADALSKTMQVKIPKKGKNKKQKNKK